MFHIVVFSVIRGKSETKITGKGFIDEENDLHLAIGYDALKEEQIWLDVFDYKNYLFPIRDKQNEYKGWFTEYIEDFLIPREDGSYDTRDIEIENYIWIKIL